MTVVYMNHYVVELYEPEQVRWASMKITAPSDHAAARLVKFYFDYHSEKDWDVEIVTKVNHEAGCCNVFDWLR